MDKNLVEALRLIKSYCQSFERDCRGCDLFIMEHGEPMCYLMDRVPEEVDVEAFETPKCSVCGIEVHQGASQYYVCSYCRKKEKRK